MRFKLKLKPRKSKTSSTASLKAADLLNCQKRCKDREEKYVQKFLQKCNKKINSQIVKRGRSRVYVNRPICGNDNWKWVLEVERRLQDAGWNVSHTYEYNIIISVPENLPSPTPKVPKVYDGWPQQ